MDTSYKLQKTKALLNINKLKQIEVDQENLILTLTT